MSREGWAVGAVLGVMAALVAAAYATGGRADPSASPSPSPSPSPSATAPFPPASIGALVPAEAVVGEAAAFESHPAVQTMRTTSTVLAWASLVDGIEFAQFTQYVDPASEPGVIGLDEHAAERPYAPIGPTPYEVRSVTENPDGSVTVRRCEKVRPMASKDNGTRLGETYDLDVLFDVTVSPLTEWEVAELAALGHEAPAMRVRAYDVVSGRDCGASSAVVQEFATWREVAPIGRYSGVRAGLWDVWVVGEDEPRRREDMP